ncbi:MAG TPA: acylphosphatase [Actinobacteria bacterium]|jgi:acylphosphatase|nr:acylphosphatase [Actinomycetota bacterium]
MARKRVRVVVSGDVQGVGFRWFTREQAMHRHLTGSVRNLHDGSVEAVFEGDCSNVDDMVAWCRHGPRMATVQDVTVTEESLSAGDSGFRILQ